MDDNSDDYSDDFEEGGPSNSSFFTEGISKVSTDNTPRKKCSTISKTSGTVLSSKKSPYSISTSTRSKGRKSKTIKRRDDSFFEGRIQWPRQHLSPHDRVMSANYHTILKLRNQLSEVVKEMDDLKKENRLLNRLQVRQEKALDHFQSREGDLPQILIRHEAEVRTLQGHLKRSQEVSNSYQKQLSDYRQELLKLHAYKKKTAAILSQKQLREREELTLELEKIKSQLEVKERRVIDLERGVQAMDKNRTTEVRGLLQKNKGLRNEIEGLNETLLNMQAKLKEKEKEMGMLNIYSLRIGKNNSLNRSRSQSPEILGVSTQTELTSSPSKVVSLYTKPPLQTSSSQTDIVSPPLQIASSQTDVVSESRHKVNCSTQTDNGTVSHPNTTSKMDTSHTDHSYPIESASITKKDSASIANKTDSASIAKKIDSAQAQKIDSASTSGKTNPVSTANQSTAKKDSATTAAAPIVTPAYVTQPNTSGLSRIEEEERQKKDLLAKLMAMDGQKNPPASKPWQSTAIDGQTQPPAGYSTFHGQTQPSGPSKPWQSPAIDGPGSKPWQSSQSSAIQSSGIQNVGNSNPADISSSLANFPGSQMTEGVSNLTGKTPTEFDLEKEERLKKEKLLAKLMAIDESDKKTQENGSKENPSWPDTVENLYNGRPAYATEDDPFGTKHRKNPVAGEKTESVKSYPSQESQAGSEKNNHRTAGRRRVTDDNNSRKSVFEDLSSGGKKSAGRNKHRSNFKGNEITYPWEMSIDATSKTGPKNSSEKLSINPHRTSNPKRGTEPLLPRRSQQNDWGHSTMKTGSIPEPARRSQNSESSFMMPGSIPEPARRSQNSGSSFMIPGSIPEPDTHRSQNKAQGSSFMMPGSIPEFDDLEEVVL